MSCPHCAATSTRSGMLTDELPHCAATSTRKRTKKTKLGYTTFFCPQCRCTFNERTGTPFNHLEFPTDIVLLAVLWRLRYKLSLCDGAEMVLARGFSLTHETIRDWEERFTSVIRANCASSGKGRLEHPGTSMRPLSKCMGSGALCIERSTTRAIWGIPC